VIFYVLEGEGELEIESNSFIMNKGDCIFVKNGTLRGWVNYSDNPMRILVIKKMSLESKNLL
jgi:quercetin dioxygenase-like cupin family protein